MELDGTRINFKLLRIKERFALAMSLGDALQGKQLDLTLMTDPETGPLMERLIALSDAPEELFDKELMHQVTVAFAAADFNFKGLFDAPDRMRLAESKHKAVRKMLAKPEPVDAAKIGPEVKKLWFLYRPVIAEVCTYREMFIDQIFSFEDINDMHEMMDVKQFNEVVAMEVD